jgi:nicotinamidase-related amidase
MIRCAAQPGDFTCEGARTALLVIDIQRDLLEPRGVGAAPGHDVAELARAVAPCRALLEAARAAALAMIHAQGGIFGWVARVDDVTAALTPA